MDYSLVFDVTKKGYQAGEGLGIGLLFIGIGAGLLLLQRVVRFRWTFLPAAFFGFAIFWTVAWVALTLTDYFELASALRHGRCDVVEGLVTQFHPMPPGGHDVESFSVGGKHFEYSDWVMSGGFHQSSTHGGPIREGLRVRIHYLGKDIARLEIARETI